MILTTQLGKIVAARIGIIDAPGPIGSRLVMASSNTAVATVSFNNSEPPYVFPQASVGLDISVSLKAGGTTDISATLTLPDGIQLHATATLIVAAVPVTPPSPGNPTAITVTLIEK